MKKHAAIFAVLTMLLTLALLAGAHYTNAQTEDPKKFERYRAAIKQECGIDIKDFKGNINGGRADGKEITKYDLQQLLMGIKVEQEHSRDKMTALEISMDHLEEFSDYYTRLKKMEDEADHDKESRDRVKKGGE